MKKLCFLLVIIISIIFVFSGNVSAFDNEKTHPALTDKAIEKSKLYDYLKNTLNFPNGTETIVEGIKIRTWIMNGSLLEDEPSCRASNHFHNPRNELSWKGTYESDPPGSGMSDEPWFVDWGCWGGDYPSGSITSNVHWATGYIEPAPNGAKVETGNQWDWDDARESYYIYLTGKDYDGDVVASPNIKGRTSILLTAFRP